MDRLNKQDTPLNNLDHVEYCQASGFVGWKYACSFLLTFSLAQVLTFCPGKAQRPINLNHYATKKSAAQSMLDVALLMANSSQLKTVLYVGPQYRFFIPLTVLLSLSITLQVIVGLLLVFIVKYDLNDVRKQAKLNTMNNAATVFVFFTVLINIFITALGFQGQSISSTTPQLVAIPETQVGPLSPHQNITVVL